MIRFLNLFAAFRDAVSARMIAESESRACRIRADRAEDRIRELERELIDTHKVLNDKLAQRFLNTRFWSETPAPEAQQQPNIDMGRRQLARSAVQNQTAAFRSALDDYFTTQS